jgi:H+/Cl- antiporter ClcA
LGLWVIPIPIIGALLVGLMARFGSKAIRGHGIPEAMEQILTNRSRIPSRITLLKPISSAIAIGTGGPFGAEGPIIATGSALGSQIGQLLSCSPAERRTLLGAGAAAGMAATFGSPVSAVLLAVELLLFEYRPRSFIPVALAATAATGLRIAIEGAEPVFNIPHLAPVSMSALFIYMLLGAFMGLVSVAVTRVVYGIEDAFEKLPVHWMWWPAIGAIAIGVIGYFAPDTLGVGYYNITNILSNHLAWQAVAFLCAMKFISWSIALGSGTSGGTLAPLFTIGGGIGALVGTAIVALAPSLGVDPRMAALVGMAALFAGASRALLASVVFAFETTQQPMALMPLLGGCAAAFLASSLTMRNTIMTEKIARRGIRTPSEYSTDPLEHVLVREIATTAVTTLRASQSIKDIQAWMTSGAPDSAHQGYPIVNDANELVGVLTRRDILSPDTSVNASDNTGIGNLIKQRPRFAFSDSTVRQATDHMVKHGIGRLPIVTRENKSHVVGIISRSDILTTYRNRIAEYETEKPTKHIIPKRRKHPHHAT